MSVFTEMAEKRWILLCWLGGNVVETTESLRWATPPLTLVFFGTGRVGVAPL